MVTQRGGGRDRFNGATRAVARTSVGSLLVRRRYAVQALLDSLAWAVALLFAAVLRYEFALERVPFGAVAAFAPLAATIQIIAGFLAGLYRGRWRFGSFESVGALARVTLVTGVLLFIVDVVLPMQPLPRSTVIGGTIAAFVMMGAGRYAWRDALDKRRRPRHGSAVRVIVMGAGEAGEQILRSMMRDPQSPYMPVALLDDDPAKRNLRLFGVPVAGPRQKMGEAATRFQAAMLIIAIPSAGANVIRDLAGLAAEVGLDVKVLPSTSELFGDVTTQDIRPITEADLLGRHQIETDIASIAGYLTGKRVLVTGAGGSIGSELCRQISQFSPAALIMLDRDESALHSVQLSIEGRALLDSPNLVLADIRDIDFIRRLFVERKPDVVFHAAALKHLPMLEQYPGEALKSNVWGTLTVLEAAAAARVGRFVNISTDKAADPTSVLGTSKRIAERLTAHVATQAEGTYLSVRFGNVLGSRGSVLTTFRSQIASGGPVTVTDPDVTRYFMTVEEAVQLVIQAGAIGKDGQALVLDMGEPVRIADVAERLAAQSPRRVSIVYTGMRPGEKLHEVLLATDEIDERPVHPLISHVPVPPLDPLTALEIDAWSSPSAVRDELAAVCCTPGRSLTSPPTL